MFEVGDNVVYGSNGVCRVAKVGTLDSLGVAKDKIYYTLSPYFIPGSTIFTPADNKKVIIRPVLSKQEAMQLIDEIKEIETLWIADEKSRENEYKEAFRKCDCRELVKIIKTIHLRQEARIAEGKKETTLDEKYFHMAEERLYEELTIPLEMTVDEVREFVIARVEEQLG